MPTSDKGRVYKAPEVAGRFEVAHHLVTVSENGDAIPTHDAYLVQATLGVHEYYQTALTGTDNDIVWIARAPGTSPLSIEYIDPSGNNKTLSLAFATNKLTVNLATGPAGAITTTANDILAAVAANGTARAKYAPVLAAGNDGTGVVTAKSVESLGAIGGGSPKLDASLETSLDGTNWFTVKAWSQKSAAGSDAAVFGPLGTYCRWVFAVSGTYPVIPVSIIAPKVRWNAT